MNTELTGPVEIWGWAEFPTHGLWKRPRQIPDGLPLCQRHDDVDSGDYPNGIKFIGTKGWLFVTREGNVTPSDPTSGKPAGKTARSQRSQDSR